jgi:16S rRNA (guanine527-N7)-methyltransferase
MASAEALATVEPYRRWLRRDGETTAKDLESFCALLANWQRVKNLVSRETLDDVWTRHVADSLQVLKLLGSGDMTIMDLGSGGGFPGSPLAIALKGGDTSFVLVEPNARKASFLRTAARELGLEVTVEAKRSDEIDSRETISPDVITSRALASLPALCGMAAPFFGTETRAIFHKGREYGEELTESRAVWHHDVVVIPSDTSETGVLLELRNLRLKTK